MRGSLIGRCLPLSCRLLPQSPADSSGVHFSRSGGWESGLWWGLQKSVFSWCPCMVEGARTLSGVPVSGHEFHS